MRKESIDDAAGDKELRSISLAATLSLALSRSLSSCRCGPGASLAREGAGFAPGIALRRHPIAARFEPK